MAPRGTGTQLNFHDTCMYKQERNQQSCQLYPNRKHYSTELGFKIVTNDTCAAQRHTNTKTEQYVALTSAPPTPIPNSYYFICK